PAKAPPKKEVARAEPKPGTAEDVARGTREGAVDGREGGVVGGVAGGVEGGVIGGRGTGPLPVAQAATAPVLLQRVEPEYPQVARRRRIEGLVLLEAILDREGHVEPGIRVVQSVPGLDASAIAAVKRW